MNDGNLYDRVCGILTEYEDLDVSNMGEAARGNAIEDITREMYDTLIDCQYYLSGEGFSLDSIPQKPEPVSRPSRSRTDLLEDFCDFVAESVMAEDFDSSIGFFAEVACRKLERLGVVKVSEDGRSWTF